jgi:hypothetical protein
VHGISQPWQGEFFVKRVWYLGSKTKNSGWQITMTFPPAGKAGLFFLVKKKVSIKSARILRLNLKILGLNNSNFIQNTHWI